MSTITKSNWQIDRKIPISVVIVLLIHTFAAVIYAAKLDFRVGALEKKVSNTDQIAERLVRVETQIQAIKESVQRIEREVSK